MTRPTWTLFDLLERAARSDAHSTALTYEGSDRSFATLRDRALRLATALHERGVGSGDHVAVLLGNRHEWVEVLFGITAAGAACVPINVLLAPPEVAHVCVDSGARCLIADGLAAKALSELDTDLGLIVRLDEVDVPAGYRTVTYDELLSTPPRRAADPSPEDPAMLYYSSGTTGAPKAAVHSHSGVLWNSLSQVADMGLTSEDVYLVVPSLSWAAGFHDVMLALAWVGGRSVLMPTGGTTPERILRAIETNGATHCLLVPSLLRQFADDPAMMQRLRDSTMRTIVTGAEPVPTQLLEQFVEELPGCRILQAYGLSEFPTIATTLTQEDALTRVGSAGRPLLHTDVAVRTDDGDIRDSGEGQLLIRSPATMRGYHNRRAETDEVFTDGWLHTGDRAQVDDDRYVTLVGRTKDMIISGGLNVYPKEIEEILHRLPGVAEAAVVGVPNNRWGEIAVAVVVASAGTTIDRDAADRACREKLAGYKRPHTILVRNEPLPRNPIGKILKRDLRPWVAERFGSSD